MKEDFLYYLWMFRLYEGELFTTSGEPIEVISAGVRNPDSGPDFMQCRVRIGSTLWAGSVEIHVKASDWYRHGHQHDPAYQGVVLHVVYEADTEVVRESGEEIPSFILKDRFNQSLFLRYEDFIFSRKWISCSGQLKEVPSPVVRSFVSRCSIERIEQRNDMIDNILKACNGDWEECCHRYFARGFGGGLNDDAFEQLAMVLPFHLCRPYTNSGYPLEALALGQAGFLEPGFHDTYPAGLWEEYQYLRNKHSLTPMNRVSWKFFRIRPAAFPTIRILQWVAMLGKHQSLVNGVLLEEDVSKITSLFRNEISEYWRTHLLPDRCSEPADRVCSESFTRVWMINSKFPLAIFYGKRKSQEERVERAIQALESFPPEQNKIISAWAEEGIRAGNAMESQGLLHLKKKYCDFKKCVNCSIGVYLLSH